ncbi:hypothetical protein BDB00DRAFT_931665 [Zychaea mexicana]|uniref:uncharacterized protein n=1 Tax=Zychaea mexicana TaxID=64656 RepID=UPI0022FEA830|nr:uncharacterized protein BDB00DRAFT_931665 [Zychaea mexicana]KAI9489820.1 hypothetical protein BDB00DRAFT_931665 [Zychaea mexicana]
MAVIHQQRVGILFCATLTCFFLVITSFFAWSSHLKAAPKSTKHPHPTIPLIDYLDATQLADSGSSSRLWSQSWYSVSSNKIIYNNGNNKELEHQQNLSDIVEFAHTVQLGDESRPSVTAIVLYNNDMIQQQVTAIQSQSVVPDFVWIVCATEDEQVVLQQQQILPKNAEIWIGDVRRIRSSTDYVWIIDKDVLPGHRYLELLLKLAQTRTYRETLLGPGSKLALVDSSESSAVSCEPVDGHQFVDVVNSAWLLRSEWLSALSTYANDVNAPLGYWISRHLKVEVGIQSVALPKGERENNADYTIRIISAATSPPAAATDACASIEQYLANTNDDSYDSSTTPSFINDVIFQGQTESDEDEGDTTENGNIKQQAVMLLVDEEDHLDTAWLQLVCEMHTRGDNNAAVHLATTGRGNLGANEVVTALTVHDAKCASSLSKDRIHDLQLKQPIQQLVPRLTRLVQSAKIQVLIHVQQDGLDAIQTMKHMLPNVAIIGLPHRDLSHVTWMSELPVDTLHQWHDFTVKLVLATESDDAPPFQRLLQSVQGAGYLGDTVDISIFMEYTSNVKTQRLSETLFWPHGEKDLRHRIVPTNRASMFVESWYPSSDHEYAVILDDGMEVSPLFYIWVKYSILKYRYTPTPQRNLFGVSLYSPRMVDTGKVRELFEPPSGYTPYLMQAPCSMGGGAVYFPEHWREFHDYMTARIADQDSHKLQTIEVPGARSRRWMHSWRRYLDELVYLRGNVMLYPNFEDNASFSTRHQLPEHSTKHADEDNLDLPGAAKAVAALYDVPLLVDTFTLPDRHLPDWGDLPVLDLFGRPATLETLAERGQELQQQVSACTVTRSAKHDYDPSDLLCPYARVFVEKEEEDEEGDGDTKTKKKKTKKNRVLPTKLVTLYVPATATASDAAGAEVTE